MSNAVLDAFYSLGQNINKQKGQVSAETEQGIVSERFPELSLEMKNEDLLKLTRKWERAWTTSNVYAEWTKKSEENENYWKGKHFQKPEVDKTRALIDNAIFESLETYLPQVTRRNPEPVAALADGVSKDEKNEAYAKEMQKHLGQLADELVLRLKLKKVARHWAIYLLGVAKYGWDMNKDIPTLKIIRPKKLILDPEATIDEDGYTGEFVGEHRKMQASKLITTLESVEGEKDAVEYLKKMVKDDLGTEVAFIEWWTNEYMCWTLDKHVLIKKKNPNWNYDTEQPGESTVDEMEAEVPGEPIEVPGVNHFPVPKMPYTFLSVFNLGLQPIDDTSLIGQNLSNQDLINKRIKQIDKNADSMNGGMIVSMERSGLSKEQAKGVTEALRKGGTIVIPTGTPDEAVKRDQAPALPPDVYNQLVDVRNRLKDIFGTRGSTPSGLETETTVRGKIMNRTLDTDRIGGGISEYLEQFADEVYNWFVQLLYVYNDTLATFPNKPKLTLSVKEGSLLPKDSTTIANQAIELAGAGKMSTVDLYKRLDYPNPEELAANVWLETNAPQILYANDPRVAQAMQMQAEAAQQQQQAEAQTDVQKEEVKHKNDMEKETLKGKVALEKEFNKIPKGQ